MDAYECRTRFREVTGLRAYADGCTDTVYWVTAISPTAGMNGYVMIPEKNHPWSDGFPKADVRRLDQALQQQLTVHGGLTYVQFPWLGFSTCHPGDRWPYDYDERGLTRRWNKEDPEPTEWSPSLVSRHAERLAMQVQAVGVKWRQARDSIAWAANVGKSRFQHLDIE